MIYCIHSTNNEEENIYFLVFDTDKKLSKAAKKFVSIINYVGIPVSILVDGVGIGEVLHRCVSLEWVIKKYESIIENKLRIISAVDQLQEIFDIPSPY
jgi:hypothetical protein